MRQLARALAVTLLAASCTATWAATEQAPQGRLPRWAVPQSYRLAFKVDPTQQNFSGTTTIKVKLTQASDHLWLDGNELKVSKVSITDAAGKRHVGTYAPIDPKAGVARVDFGGTLPPQELTLAFDYSAPLNAQLEGLYKVSADGKSYAMTQMEAISARYAFPSFDEPGFKTPFVISLTIPTADVAVANTRQVSETPAGEGWKTLTFAQTLPLPTYLVAFAVGPWDIAKAPDIAPNAYRTEPLPLRGIAVSGEAHRIAHVLGETPRIIQVLENYYGFGYPFDKLDILAAPDFSAGAMENAGLVTFRDWLLLLDPDSSAAYVHGAFDTTAHELAHQWTGDTVTLTWWNEIWLNESFATWMQQKITAQVHPEYRADLDRINGAHAAMDSDSLASARKVRQPITGNGDIETAFDGITYEKGASVLGMFEAYVGEDVFQHGMRAYIQQHKFGNVDADDLVDAIAVAAGTDAHFKQDFKSFLDQAGVPYVQTRLARKDGKVVLELSQRRYLPLGSDGDSRRVWGVPVCVRYGVAGGSKVSCELLDQAQGSMVLADASEPLWVMPNANGSGYYRFGMAKADLASLGQRIGQLADTEQLAYADAVKAGFRNGNLDAGDVLAALQPLTASKTLEVATAPLAQLVWIDRYEATTQAQHDRLAAWVKQAYLPRLQQLGYRRKNGEADSDSLLRAELAAALGLDFRIPEVREALLKQGEAVLQLTKDGRLDFSAADRDLLATTLALTVREHGKTAVDVLMPQAPKTSDAALRNAVLGSLSYAQDPALTDSVRGFALNPQVKVGEMSWLMHGSHDTEAQRDALWHWSVANYDKIVARIGRSSGGFLPRLMGGGGCSQAEADRLVTFFTPRLKDLTGADRGLAQTHEATLLCAALKAKQDPAAIMR